MVTPTTKNPYLLYGAEPPNWFTHGNTEPWEDYKKRIQAQNEMWWKVHTADGNYPHQTTTELGVEGSDFPLGQGNRYGPFIYCPFPTEGIVRWAFRREDGFAAFRVDLANDSLPKGGAPKAIISHDAPKAKPTAKAAAPAPATDAFADLTDAAHVEPPAADIDLSADLDLTAAEPDPFADLEMGSEPTAEAVEADPFADLDMGAPAADPAPAEPTFAAEIVGNDDPEEPETDEWGEPIVKPGKPASADPFEGLM